MKKTLDFKVLAAILAFLLAVPTLSLATVISDGIGVITDDGMPASTLTINSATLNTNALVTVAPFNTTTNTATLGVPVIGEQIVVPGVDVPMGYTSIITVLESDATTTDVVTVAGDGVVINPNGDVTMGGGGSVTTTTTKVDTAKEIRVDSDSTSPTFGAVIYNSTATGVWDSVGDTFTFGGTDVTVAVVPGGTGGNLTVGGTAVINGVTTLYNAAGGTMIPNAGQAIIDNAAANVATQADVDANEVASDAADTAIQADVDANEVASDAADTAIQADVDANEVASDAADAAIQADVDANEVASDAADAAIQADVDANEVASDAADAAIQADVDANEVASDAADAAIQADVDANEVASDAADAAELARATAAEGAIQADVDANEVASDAADAAEAAARAAADAAEATARAAADAAEATARANADAAIQADVDANEVASDAADVALQADIDAEVAARTALIHEEADGIHIGVDSLVYDENHFANNGDSLFTTDGAGIAVTEVFEVKPSGDVGTVVVNPGNNTVLPGIENDAITSKVFTQIGDVTQVTNSSTGGGVKLETNGDVTLTAPTTAGEQAAYLQVVTFDVLNATGLPIAGTEESVGGYLDPVTGDFVVLGPLDGAGLLDLSALNAAQLAAITEPLELNSTGGNLIVEGNAQIGAIADVEAAITDNTAANVATQADVDANEVASDAADAAIQADVDANEVASNNADAAIQADVDANEVASNNADAAIQADVDQNEADSDAADAAEATARANADAAEATARANADAAEATARANADSAEASARISADNAIRADFSAADANLQGQIDDTDERLDRVGAMSAAFSALVPNDRAAGNAQISLGLGSYSGETAIAAGIFYYVNDSLLLNAGGSFASGENAGRAGVTYGF